MVVVEDHLRLHVQVEAGVHHGGGGRGPPRSACPGSPRWWSMTISACTSRRSRTSSTPGLRMAFTTVVAIEDHLRLHVQVEDGVHHGGGGRGPPPPARPGRGRRSPRWWWSRTTSICMSWFTAVVVDDHLRLHVAQIEDKLHPRVEEGVHHGGGRGRAPRSGR